MVNMGDEMGDMKQPFSTGYVYKIFILFTSVTSIKYPASKVLAISV